MEMMTQVPVAGAVHKSLFNRLARISNVWRLSAARRRAYSELLGMPDHILRDVGVTRDQVRRKRMQTWNWSR